MPKPIRIIVALSCVAAVFIAAFLFWGIRGSWDYVVPLRLGKLAALVLVAYSVAVSTVLFQTVTHNRILTPAIMGFDQLYLLIQTLIVFFVGSFHLPWYDGPPSFIIEAGILVLFAATLFRSLFIGYRKSLHLVLLVGIICGVFFRSLTSLMQRMIDPDSFVTLQDKFFANFNSYNDSVFTIAFIIVAIVSLIGWRISHMFDILALGRETAINLGLEYKRVVTTILVLVTILVAVSTALVGPVTFFGLMIASLAYQLAGSSRHKIILPIAVLLGIIFLVGGQFMLEHVFHFNTALSIIIEFVGGIIFIVLLLKGKMR